MSTRSPEEIRNILNNLNTLEDFFLDQTPNAKAYNDISTYLDFLNNYFIRENQLAGIYFQQLPGDVKAFWKTFRNLDEAYVIFSGVDVSVYKQFNFPSSRPHTSGTFECIYVLQGSCLVSLSGKEYALKEGMGLFHCPGEIYSTNSAPGSIVINLNIRSGYMYSNYQTLFSACPVALRFFDSCLQKNGGDHFLLFESSNACPMQELILQMFAESLASDHFKNEILRFEFGMFVSYLKRFSGNRISSNEKLSVTEIYYHQIMEYLRDEYRSASLEEAADRLHVSKNYVTRIMHNVGNTTFVDALNTIRVQKVEEYLSETELLLDDIAELTGFSDTSYLWRVFRKKTGKSPTEFRG